jgi:hypothetical protein
VSELNEETYLWEHWKFNADQRIRAFNFYVVFAIFGNGMVFTAFDKCAHPAVMVLLGAFISLLAVVFAIVDSRSRHLLHITKAGLKHFEQKLPEHARPLHLDELHRQRWVNYTVAFNLLFGMQLVFGLIVSLYGATRW